MQNQERILQKVEEARRIRKLSKKNEMIKFRKEVQLVKENIEKRDKIWLSEKKMKEDSGSKDLAKVQLRTKQENLQKKEKHVIDIFKKQKEIKKLANIEKKLVDRLRNTIDFETSIN